MKPGPRQLRRLEPVRAITLAWRRVASGRRTVVACSGGADSTALALALASVTDDLILAHAEHDLRPPEQTRADAEAVERLADQLALPYRHARVEVAASPGNAEANARRARYRALRDIAIEADAGFVATGHTANDQLESMLMALLRGAGPRGLAGMAPSRRLAGPSHDVRLIRPALAVTAHDTRDICAHAGAEWREDETNQDRTRTRAWLRAELVPALLDHRARLPARLASTSLLLRDAASMIDAHARRAEARATIEPGVLDRRALACERAAVIGAVIRNAAIAQGVRRDRLGMDALEPLIRAIRDDDNTGRAFTLSGLTACLSRDRVTLDGVP